MCCFTANEHSRFSFHIGEQPLSSWACALSWMCHTSTHPSVEYVFWGRHSLLQYRGRQRIRARLRWNSVEGHCPVWRQGTGRFHRNPQPGKPFCLCVLWVMRFLSVCLDKIATLLTQTKCMIVWAFNPLTACVSMYAAQRHYTQKAGRDWLPSGEKHTPEAAGQPCKTPGHGAWSE